MNYSGWRYCNASNSIAIAATTAVALDQNAVNVALVEQTDALVFHTIFVFVVEIAIFFVYPSRYLLKF